LVAEVLSPSSRRRDLVDKRLVYQAHGVETHWALDPEARMVEVWQPRDTRPLIATEELEWRVVPETPVLRIDLAALFGEPPR
jgi:Uma2 family endonuclease